VREAGCLAARNTALLDFWRLEVLLRKDQSQVERKTDAARLPRRRTFPSHGRAAAIRRAAAVGRAAVGGCSLSVFKRALTLPSRPL
jgi:hypothetical protein